MPEELVIDDSNYHLVAQGQVVAGEYKARGLVPRTAPFGSIPCAPASAIAPIPRDQWAERYEEMKFTKSFLSDIRTHHKLKSSNQGQIPFCWIHGPTNAERLCRARDNQPYVELSATSAGCQIKNFRKEGGWGKEGIEFLAEHGACSTEFWPENSFDRKHLTDAMRANARLHRVTEWDDLPQRNLDILQTYLFLRIPVAVGYNWWSHEVCAVDPVETGAADVRTESGKLGMVYESKFVDSLMELAGYGDSFFDIRIWNSWSDSWSSNGMGVLRGSKALPDDAVAPRVIVAATV